MKQGSSKGLKVWFVVAGAAIGVAAFAGQGGALPTLTQNTNLAAFLPLAMAVTFVVARRKA